MNQSPDLISDQQIERMLARRTAHAAPPQLLERISRAAAAAPQRIGLWERIRSRTILEHGLGARPPADPVDRSRIAATPPPVLGQVAVRRPGAAGTSRPMLAATRLVAAVAIVALGTGALFLAGGQGPSPVPTAGVNPTPARLRSGSLPAGTYLTAPFAQPGSDACIRQPRTGCPDLSDDDSIGVTFTVPAGWIGYGSGGIYPDHAPIGGDGEGGGDGAGLLFVRGASLYSDPCHDDDVLPDIPVGPTAADFADALAAHPLLDVTTPVDVTLAGYTGKYVDLQVPTDWECTPWRPWELGFRFSGPGARWHLWILDVDGIRVVIQAMDRAGTSPELRAQLRTIVDSISIEPTTAPAAPPSSGPLAWTPASAERDWPAPVRTEPVGDPVIVPLAGSGYTDPSWDIASPDMPWIDIQSVTESKTPSANFGSVSLGIAKGPPTPPAGSNEPWIAYGIVLDTDADGVADVRIGMDVISGRWNKGEPRVWRTDLHTGRTESGFQVGPVWLCDCSWPGPSQDEPGANAKMGLVLRGPDVPARFYAWASVIRDGRVFTDYAPDTGWLEVSSPSDLPGY